MKTLIIGLFALLTAGCNVLPETPVYAVHDFGAAPLIDTADSIPYKNVSVEAPEWLTDQRIRYRLLYATPTQVRFYALDRWLAPPNELLEQRIANHPGLSEKTKVTLELQRFEQQFIAPGQAKAVLGFKVISTSDDLAPSRREKIFILQKNCPTADAKGAVSTFAELANRAATDINTWLQQPN